MISDYNICVENDWLKMQQQNSQRLNVFESVSQTVGGEDVLRWAGLFVLSSVES